MHRISAKKIGAQILSELERWASELGYAATILETGHRQVAAVTLYKNSGYEVIPNYDQYVGIDNSICMKKLFSRENTAAV